MGKGRNIQRKKRKHHFGNQFFNKKPKTDEQNQKKEIDCASSTKIDDLPFIEKNVDKMSYNLIIDISILQNMISAIGPLHFKSVTPLWTTRLFTFIKLSEIPPCINKGYGNPSYFSNRFGKSKRILLW